MADQKTLTGLFHRLAPKVAKGAVADATMVTRLRSAGGRNFKYMYIPSFGSMVFEVLETGEKRIVDPESTAAKGLNPASYIAATESILDLLNTAFPSTTPGAPVTDEAGTQRLNIVTGYFLKKSQVAYREKNKTTFKLRAADETEAAAAPNFTPEQMTAIEGFLTQIVHVIYPPARVEEPAPAPAPVEPAQPEGEVPQ